MTTSISSDKKLDQKVAIITGASSGIGRATAVLFSRLGARLALTGRNQENLTKSAEECEAVSPYNLKVNNAGIAALDSAEDGSLAILDLIWKTNVRMATSISSDKKLDQKVAIITGASSGIGRATAVLFSRLGAKLALTGRNIENLIKSTVECEAVSPYNLKVNNAVIVALDSAQDGSLGTLDLVWKTNVR
ncbi:NAD-dependent glycerol dehydrogenase-like [Tachypleus tridentatus]|uniref:NAD-dependent glycerol dehydrogenase-like n=1 Tax=Tachypleus tridentatus TaxID=6853 RepID=UPI003FD3831A